MRCKLDRILHTDIQNEEGKQALFATRIVTSLHGRRSTRREENDDNDDLDTKTHTGKSTYADNVDQDLAQSHAVSNNHLRDLVLDQEPQLQAFLNSQSTEEFVRTFSHGVNAKRFH